MTKKDQSALGKLTRLKSRYDREGTIRSVEGVVLFHEHDHPHILLLRYTSGAINGQQNGGNVPGPATVSYRLPGGKCKADEREADCLLRKLGRRLLGYPKPIIALAAQQMQQQQQQNAENLLDATSSMSPKNSAILRSSGTLPANSLASPSGGLGQQQQDEDDDFFTSSYNNLSTTKTPIIGASVATLGIPPPLPGAITPTKTGSQTVGGLNGGSLSAVQHGSPNMSHSGIPQSIGASPIINSGNNAAGTAASSAIMTACANATQAASEHFRVGEMVSRWYRPNFDRLLYPYVPPHVTSVKERKSVFVVHVEPTTRFLLNHTGEQLLGSKMGGGQRGSRNSSGGNAFSAYSGSSLGISVEDEPYELVAVPLFEVYQNAQKYGTIIESLPDVVSRFHINFC